jgi:hypothetical protein
MNISFNKIILFFYFFFLLIIIYPGIYYEDISDVNFSIMSSGFFTSKPISLFNSYGAHFLLTHLYTFLEQLIAIGWYGIINVFILFLAIVNLYYCLFLSTISKSNFYRYGFFLVLFPFLFYDIIFLQYTKTSIYLIFSSIWLLTYHLRGTKENNPSFIFLFYNLLLLFIGMLLRPFSIILIVLLYFPILLLHLKQNKKLQYKLVIKYFSVFFIMSVFVFVFSSYSLNTTDKEYSAFAEYKISVWDNGQSINSLHLKTNTDSIKFECFSKYFLPEKSIVDASYLESIGIKKTHSPLKLLNASLHELPLKTAIAVNRWKELFGNYTRNLYTLLILLLLLFFNYSNKQILAKQLICILWIAICLLILSILVKMEERVLYPSIFILIVLLVDNLSVSENKFTSRFFVFVFIILILISNFLFMNTTFHNSKIRRNGQQEINTFINETSKISPKKIVILDWLSINILENRVITFNKELNKLRWFTLDPGYLVFYTEYSLKQKQLTGTTKFEAFIEYAVHHKDQFTFIFSEDRILLIKKYYKTIYHKDIEFIFQKPLFTKGDIFNGHYGFYEYSIE